MALESIASPEKTPNPWGHCLLRGNTAQENIASLVGTPNYRMLLALILYLAREDSTNTFEDTAYHEGTFNLCEHC